MHALVNTETLLEKNCTRLSAHSRMHLGTQHFVRMHGEKNFCVQPSSSHEKRRADTNIMENYIDFTFDVPMQLINRRHLFFMQTQYVIVYILHC